jgi:hypothetical protein
LPDQWKESIIVPIYKNCDKIYSSNYHGISMLSTSYKLVLSGCETWSLTLWEEHRLRIFENRVLRRIFGPKNVEVMEGWRKLHNDELHNLYSSPSIIRMIKLRISWGQTCSTNGGKRNMCRLLVGKPEGHTTSKTMTYVGG